MTANSDPRLPLVEFSKGYLDRLNARLYEIFRRMVDHDGWADLLTDISAGRGVGANAPTWAAFQGGISAYRFDAGTMNEIWFNVHIPHDYRFGTAIYPHIHWSTTGTNAGTVRWGLEYTFARGYGIEAFPATTTIYIEQAASGTARTHMIAEPTDANAITLTNCEPDMIMMCRFFRDAAHVNDTCTDTAFAFYADMHYQSDGYLTPERNRAFSKRKNVW